MIRRLTLIVAGLLAVAPASAQAPVRIGLSAPLTGPDAAFGQGLRQGAEQAVIDLNRAAGGRPRWVLVPADDAGEGRQAVAVARKFAADGVRLVVGPFESGAVASAAPVYEDAGTVSVTSAATYAPLTGRGLWNLFRLSPSDAQQGQAAGAYLARAFAGRRIGILNDRSTFGRGLAEAVAARLKEAGTPEVLFDGFARGTRDLSELVARLKAARIDAVYFGGLAPEAAILLHAMRDAGLAATLVASDGILDPGFATAAGALGEGTVMTLSPDPPRLPEVRGVRSSARSSEADSVASGAYAAVQILAEAVERARAADPKTGRIADGRSVADALRAGPMRTLLGPVGFDARGDRTGSPIVLRIWRRSPDGRLDYAGNEVAAP
ncbi:MULTISPECIES: branched-chain amino acid ABC transporter substrate-binding protein [Methylobacterium]|jgi:branched-chain amino acid transport system substrate-binding protein|uniref:Branched-chain amino acid ABC transporter substrate-binding protein n=1 Tax=Methylobacterium longum TaxID=767694 RepID=A0ABT8AMC2_9HYPH|nr:MULTISPECIES: branched-chain amino acid ABC transporter substrate-binding protein [Methylobacterium]MCJ2101521.1 branched-chain amino acid ABC transporter substrate-binding protein [Methylobacterium sp. E-046]MDN3570775.1 branched-chain amino acid ABC transporter substrate-binding protein [Methylobacterium longum]GJE09918.1 Leu/Ile/Val-binding protein [Methylobacterium longum]